LDHDWEASSVTKKILLVVKSPPYGSLWTAECFRVATAMIAMDVLPQLLFMDDGVYCLLKNQKPEAAGLNPHHERLRAIADLVGLHVLSASMVKRNLRTEDFDENYKVKTLSINEAAELVMKNEAILTF